ncbi:hypothetical protein NC651_018240 [Populus alba x Populus x berolinensis]|nr:hypothetical protein NC651_018240 [Populus alba x Populus x berolinensis]
MEVLRKDSAHGTTVLSASFIRFYYVPFVWHRELEFLQDCQTPTLIMSPSRTLDPRGSSSGGICPNVASSIRIPLGADPKGLGPSSDHSPLTLQPSMVSAFLGVASPNDENPQDCNEGTVGVSASPNGPSWVLHASPSGPSWVLHLNHVPSPSTSLPHGTLETFENYVLYVMLQVGPTASGLGPSVEIAIMDHQHLQDSGMPQGEPCMDPMSAEVATMVDNWVEIRRRKKG